jgi:hypothetical protein
MGRQETEQISRQGQSVQVERDHADRKHDTEQINRQESVKIGRQETGKTGR